jgi:hypothetical protein
LASSWLASARITSSPIVRRSRLRPSTFIPIPSSAIRSTGRVSVSQASSQIVPGRPAGKACLSTLVTASVTRSANGEARATGSGQGRSELDKVTRSLAPYSLITF